MSANKTVLSKASKQSQLNIEDKIDEANSLVIKQKENKRENSRNDDDDKDEIVLHHNPHMQIKDSRRDGDDKRVISSGRRGDYAIPAHSPSSRQPTTAEKYTLFGHSEDSTI